MKSELPPANQRAESLNKTIIEAVKRADFVAYLEALVELDKMSPGAARRERPAYEKEIIGFVKARKSTLERFKESHGPEEVLKLKELFDQLEQGQTMKNQV